MFSINILFDQKCYKQFLIKTKDVSTTGLGLLRFWCFQRRQITFYTLFDLSSNIWTYSSSNTSLEACFHYLCHRERKIPKYFFLVFKPEKTNRDIVKNTSFFNIIHSNLPVVTIPLLPNFSFLIGRSRRCFDLDSVFLHYGTWW